MNGHVLYLVHQPGDGRAAALGIVMVSQPGFLSALGDGFAAAFPDRCDQLYSFASRHTRLP